MEASGFAADSAFPGLQVLRVLAPMLRRAEEKPEAKLVCFGHSDAEGDGDKKTQSDRRSAALHALLTSERDAFDDLDAQEGWDVIHYQEMLCALGYTMPLDGEVGPKTQRGTRKF